MNIRPIPNDVAHCPGMPWPDFGVQPECLSCARFMALEPYDGDPIAWMEPPAQMPCEQRMPE